MTTELGLLVIIEKLRKFSLSLSRSRSPSPSPSLSLYLYLFLSLKHSSLLMLALLTKISILRPKVVVTLLLSPQLSSQFFSYLTECEKASSQFYMVTLPTNVLGKIGSPHFWLQPCSQENSFATFGGCPIHIGS